MRSSFVCAFVCACVLFIVLTRERERELICDTYFSEIKKRKNRENREGLNTPYIVRGAKFLIITRFNASDATKEFTLSLHRRTGY